MPSQYLFLILTGLKLKAQSFSGGFIPWEKGKVPTQQSIDQPVFCIFNIFIIESLQDGQVMLPLSNLETGFYVNNQSFFSFGPKFLASFTENLGLSGAIYFAQTLLSNIAEVSTILYPASGSSRVQLIGDPE